MSEPRHIPSRVPNVPKVALCDCGHGVMAHLRTVTRDRFSNLVHGREACQAGDCQCVRFSLKEFAKL